MTHTRRFAERTLGLFAVLALASCFGEKVAGPEMRRGFFAIAPAFDRRALAAVTVDSVHIVVLLPGTSTVVLDTTVVFPRNADTLDISIPVPISGGSQTFNLNLDLKDATGAVLFHSGPTAVVATTPGVPPPVTPLVVKYVGVGANAKGVRFTASPSSVFFGDSVTFVAEAFDSNSVAIPNTPILFSSSDTLKAKLPSATSGKVLGQNARGKVTITAQLLTPPSITAPLVVQPLPSAIAVASGSGQSGPAGQALAQPIVAKVTASDNLGVQGVTVNFAVVTGGGSLSAASAVTDSLGQAQVSWTLGSGAIGQSVSATVAGLPSATTSFSATATSGPAKALFFTTQPPASPVAGGAFGVVVTARDTFGNTAATFNGNVTLALAANPGGATLSGTLTVAAASGVATFSNLSLNLVASGYTLSASAATLTGATSGSFAVSPGAAASVALVSGNLQIATVGGALTNPIVVKVTDAQGNAVSGQAVTFAVASGGGSLGTTSTATNAQGLAQSTWTAGTATFTQTATATSGTLTGSPVTFTSLGTPPGMTHRWLGISTNWHLASNWSAGTVPTATSNVFIPRVGGFAANSPVLTAAGLSLDLFSEPGSVLDLGSFGHNAAGNVGVSSIVATGGGILTLSGTAMNLAGSLPATTVTGTYTLSGLVNVTGALSITAGNLTLGGQKATVTGNLLVSGGAFTMNNALDSLLISGNVGITSGSSNTTGLISGVMAVGGNFTQTAGSSTNFAPSSTHKVVLNGSAAQTVSFSNPGPSTFGTLDIANTVGGVNFATAAAAAGTVSVLGPTNVTGSAATMTIGGSLADASGTRWQVAHTVFSGGAPSLPATIASNVTFTGTATLPNGFTITSGDSLTVSNGNLNLNGFSVRVAGSFLVSAGVFTMQNASDLDSLVITGNAKIASGSSNTGLTHGVMLVGGSFTQLAGSSANFLASGTHKVVLNGGAAQTVSFSNPGASAFGNLDIANTLGGVNFASSASASGSVAVLGTTNVTGTGVAMTIGGSLTDASNTRWQVASTIFTGVAPSLPDTVTSNVTFTGTAILPKGFKVAGGDSLTVGNGNLSLNGKTVRVTGSFLVSAGVFTMQNASDLDSLVISGNAKIASGSSNTGLSHGVMLVGGSFTQLAGSSANFLASGTHKVVLNGGAAQTVNFSNPGASAFGNLDIANTLGGVSFATAATAGGNVAVLGTTNVTGTGVAMTIGGSLTDASNTRWQLTSTVFTGATPSLPDTVTSNVTFTGTATLPKGFKVAGGDSLTVGNGNLNLNGKTLRVTGSFLVSGGVFTMQNASDLDSLIITGNAKIASGSSNTGLTHGVMLVGGSFTQLAGSSANFVPSLTHKLVLNGTLAQTVNFSNPGASIFQNLDINNAAGVSFTSAFTAAGNVTSLAGNVTGAVIATLGGNLTDASGTRWQVATTTITGSTPTLPATITTNLVFNPPTSTTLQGRVGLTGNVSVTNGTLTLNNHAIVATGTLTVSGGLVAMTSVNDTMRVAGAATISSGSSNSSLTAGVLIVGGNFTQTAGSSANFVGSGTHKTLLNGGTLQTVSFTNPGSSAFNNLEIANVSGVTFPGNAQANGTLTLTTGSIGGAGTLTVVGSATTAAATTISITGLTLGGSLTVGNAPGFTPNTTTFTGTAQSIPGTPVTYTNVVTTGPSVTFGGNTTISGSLGVTNGNLTVGGTIVNVTGALTVSGGTLTMNNVLDSLKIGGAASFTSGSSNANLTAGVLAVGGNFSQTAGSSVNFGAGGTHTTTFNGTGKQVISFTNPGTGSSRFQNLDIRNAFVTGGVRFGSNIEVLGNVLVATGATLATDTLGARTIGIGGSLTDNTPVRWKPNTTVFRGSGTLAFPTTVSSHVQMASAADITAGNNFTMDSSLTIASGSFTVGGKIVKVGPSGCVNCNMTVPAGVLIMTNAADSLTVGGNFTVGSGSSNTTFLTAGVLAIAGNFSQVAGSSANFAPSGSFTVLFNGGTNGTVSFTNPTSSFFRRFMMRKGAGSGITLLTNVRASSFSNQGGTTTLVGSSAATQFTVDSLFSTTGNITSPLTLVLNGTVCDSGATTADTIVFAGVNQPLTTTGCPASGFGSITYKSIRVTDSLGAFVGSFTVPVDLVIGSATNPGVVTVPASSTLTVTGKLKTQGNGALRMSTTLGGGNVTVGDSAVFAGGSETGRLAAGTLTLNGSFVQSTNGTAFAPSGTHTTSFGGSGASTISFANPTTSFFHALTVSKTGSVRFLTDAIINNGLSMPGGASPDTLKGPGAHIKVAGGALTMTQSTGSPVLDSMSSIELVAAPTIGASLVLFSPDTTIYSGSVTSLPTGTGITYNSVRVGTTGTMSIGTATIAKDLVVSAGTAQCSTFTNLTINGKLKTTGTGIFSMIGSGYFVTVTDSAIFGGGSTVGLLTGGTLQLNGNFNQLSTGSATAFQASSSHSTVFQGSTLQTVLFASAGSGVSNSQFYNLSVEKAGSSAGIKLLSNIFVNGSIQDSTNNAAVTDSIYGAGFTVTTGGISLGSRFAFDSASVTLNGSSFFTTGLSFNHMDLTSTFLAINAPLSSVISVSGLAFNSTPSTGKYFTTNAVSPGSTSFTVTSGVPAYSAATFVSGTTYIKATGWTITWNTIGL